MKKILSLSILGLLLSTSSCLKEEDSPIEIPALEGTVMSPNVGGAAQPNQIWVDLSAETSKSNQRPDWDLGFYSGDEFRVILNFSTMMAAGAIESTDIDAVTQNDFQSIINSISPTAGISPQFIDNTKGNYLDNGTVIQEISTNELDNKVYLLKLGYENFSGSIPPFTTVATGSFRGYKKIRILRNDANSYKIQFADLDATSHQEIIVQKNQDYHFSFFSFKTESTVEIQPEKQNWDLCFTVFNNVIEGLGTYIYADFVVNNSLSNVTTYEVIGDPLTIEYQYNNFNISQIDHSQFIENDQTAIGSKWRTTVSGTVSQPVINNDRFYIIKDAEGKYFKLRFLSMLNNANERGYPMFEYEQID